MKIAYTFSRETLRQGAKEFLMHRHRILTVLRLAIGILFLLIGILYLFGTDDPVYASGGIVCAVGSFYLIRFIFRTDNIVKNAFKANPNERLVALIIEDDTIFITDGESEGKSPLSALVDFKICKTGILLYPQKNIFYWIPKTATIEGGTWQEFESLISKKITRKI